MASNLEPQSSQSVVFIGKKEVSRNFSILRKNAPPFDFEVLARRLSDISDSFFTRLPNLVIFVCVPPQSVLPAVLPLLARLEAVRTSCTFVFCNNGLLDAEVEIAVRSYFTRFPESSVFRALVHVGVMRGLDPDVVTHHGGNRIEYGLLMGNGDSAKYVTSGVFLNWVEVGDIRLSEAQKFFTNLLLAYETGPNLTPNNSVLPALETSETKQLAENFSKIFPDRPLNPVALLQAVGQTVRSTAQNVNSVSFAWKNGNEEPLRFLLQQLKEIVNLNIDDGIRTYFQNFEKMFWR